MTKKNIWTIEGFFPPVVVAGSEIVTMILFLKQLSKIILLQTSFEERVSKRVR